ncbi:MAG: hypothetical protein ACI9U2_000212 [Bradymonadia bacterium]|jgi:hypothetical protein
MNRTLLALTLAVSLFGCAKMEDSASGAEPGWAKNANQPTAAAAAAATISLDTPSYAPPEETVNQRLEPVTVMDRARMPADKSKDSAAAFKHLNAIDTRTIDRRFSTGFNGPQDGTGVVPSGAGGMGLRGSGKGGGGEGLGLIGGLNKVSAGNKGRVATVDGTVVNGAIVNEISDAENDRGFGLRGQQALKRRAFEQVNERNDKSFGAKRKPLSVKAEKKDAEEERRSEVSEANQRTPDRMQGTDIDDRWQIDDAAWSDRPLMTAAPVKTLPRMFYFENTYLGRTAAFQERLRRLDAALSNPQAYVHTALDPQRLDAPTDAGLSITTALDRAHPTEPGRVFLQVALQGSHRYGWRRPPLDLAVVLDPHAMAHQGPATRRMLDRLLAKLGPQDRLGVVLATDPPRVLVDVQDLRDARDALRSLDGSVVTGGTQIAGAMRLAGARLAAISVGQARIPGSQTLLVVTNGRADPAPAAQVAHALTVQGAVTSVIDLSDRWGWWSVANAGHGQLYSEIDVVEAVDAELDRASKVVARLLRVNIKLAAGVRAVRVLGSRMLEDAEVKAVKAREVATDLQISKTMGVKADRGDDDDGIQTVIPFFYGGDAHVIMVELWVEKPRRGMPVAEVSLRYKDMVALGNATARSHATLDAFSGPTTPAEMMVRRNVRGFELAEALGKASALVARGQTDAARRLLDQAVAVSPYDRRLVDNLRTLLARSVDVSVKQAALAYAGQRRISHVAAVSGR